MTYCELNCAAWSVFDGSCACHEAARTALDRTLSDQKPRTGVRVTRKREKRDKGATK